MARVSQLRFCRISVMLAQGLLLPLQNRVGFLAFEYRFRGRDPMLDLIMYSSIGRTKVLYAVSFTDLGQVLQVKPLDAN